MFYEEDNYNIIKVVIIISIFIFFLRNIYINNKGISIDIDNIMDIPEYERDINFSNFSKEIKPIALYFPNYYPIQINYNPSEEYTSEWEIIKNTEPLYKEHHQPRIPDEKYININNYDISKLDIIENQIKLAKSHGIYGFAIYYYWFSGKKIYNKPLNLIFENKKINFHFFLIWKNNDLKINNKLVIEQKYENNYEENFFEDIKNYLKDSRYIKNNGKSMIGIYKADQITNLNNLISMEKKGE